MPRSSSNQSSAQAQQDLVSEGIENFELPKALVTKIAKSVIPENTKLQKESILSLVKGSTVFINYLAATAHDVAVSKQHKSISASDVLKALEMIEFGDLVETLNAELQVYRELAKMDKSKKGNANVGVGALPPGGVPGTGSTGPAGATSTSNANGNSISSSGNSNGAPSGTSSSLPPIKLKVSASSSPSSTSSADKGKGKSKAFDPSTNSPSSKVVIIGPGGNSSSPSAGGSARFGSAPYVSSPLARGSTTGPVPMDVDDDSGQINGISQGANTTANDDDTEDEERAQGGTVEEYDEDEDEDSGELPVGDEDDEEGDEDEGGNGGVIDEDEVERQEGDEEPVDRMQVEEEERGPKGLEDHAKAPGHEGHVDDDD